MSTPIFRAVSVILPYLKKRSLMKLKELKEKLNALPDDADDDLVGVKVLDFPIYDLAEMERHKVSKIYGDRKGRYCKASSGNKHMIVFENQQ